MEEHSHRTEICKSLELKHLEFHLKLEKMTGNGKVEHVPDQKKGFDDKSQTVDESKLQRNSNKNQQINN